MKIGLITFHGSHNHGSMLQAYATQQILNQLGYENEIINFRMKSQKEYYALYQTHYGFMRFFRGIILNLPFHFSKKKRFDKFENFLRKRYKLSGAELNSYDDLKKVSDKYTAFISGSDQIWSNRIPELVHSDIDYSGVYFLDFACEQSKKVAYASSIGESTYEELLPKKELLLKYQAISTREKSGAEILSKIIKAKVETVLDPTLLLNKKDWNTIAGKSPLIKGKYALLYTLQGIRPGREWAKYLHLFGEKMGLQIICVSPFVPIISTKVRNLINVGPEDFINLIEHAEVIFTDSFHGTAFSINLNKPFYSLNRITSKDKRKIDLLKLMRLENRSISSPKDILSIKNYNLEYTEVNKILNEERVRSKNFLIEAFK